MQNIGPLSESFPRAPKFKYPPLHLMKNKFYTMHHEDPNVRG